MAGNLWMARHYRLAGIVTACIGAAGLVHAQERAAAPPAHNTFALMGCLEPAPRSAGRYMLTRAEPLGQAPPVRATPSTGVVGTAGRSPAYELMPVTEVGKPGVNEEQLKAHLGQRVRVSIRPIEPAAPATPSSASKADSAAQAAADAAAPPERFSVTEIARVDGSCS